MTKMMNTGAVLALLLGGLGACAPAEDNSDDSARVDVSAESAFNADINQSAAALEAYEALVAAKPAAEAGSPFFMEPHKPSNRLFPEPVLSEGFSLDIDFPKSDFVIGEPVIMRTTLTNTSDEPLEVAPLLDVTFDRFQVSVTLPDGSVQPYRSMIQACTLPKVAIRTIEPGETFSNDVKIFAPKGGWLFAEEGDYVINAKLKGMTKDAELVIASPVELTVLRGSDDDQAVANMIMDGQAAILLDWRSGDSLERGQATLETIVRDYPETVHAIYAGHTLGNIWSDDAAKIDGARPADFIKAVGYLTPAFERVMSEGAPVVAPDVVAGIVDRLAISQQALGNNRAAASVLSTFVDTYGANPFMADAIADAQLRLSELR